MKVYFVLGFLFSPDFKEVVLINKEHPEWQKGFLNGIGGKAENQETLQEAMRREFKEEAGLDIPYWNEVGVLDGKDFKVVVYTQTSELYKQVQTKEDEVIEIIKVSDIKNRKVIPNLQWLIPLCIHYDFSSFIVSYQNKLPK